MAVQPIMGILPEWWLRAGSGDRADIVVDGAAVN